MNIIVERLIKLREMMKNEGVNWVYVPTNDFHLSEYIGDYFKCREFISGFTGSAGDVLVGLNNAYLWVDSRYYIQAEEQIKGTGIELFKEGLEGVPSFFNFVESSIKESETIAFDARVVSVDFGKKIESLIAKKNAKILKEDFIDKIWFDRKQISMNKAFLLSDKKAGQSRVNKIKYIQDCLNKDNQDLTIICSLDDIMWLLNIRGNDVDYSPVALSYLIISQNECYFYCFDEILNLEIKDALIKDGIQIKSYFDIYNDVKNFNSKKIVVDFKRINYQIYESIKNNSNNHILNKENYSLLKKAKKNKVEIRNIRNAHIKDGVAMVKFLYWLKHDKGYKDELSVADKLLSFRKMQKDFLYPSFETICGYKEHGAIVHYAATEETNKIIKNEGLLLIDSGGQYLDGTTDITRTIVMGKISKSMKRDFTLVLKGHLNLMNAKFLYGVRGNCLDILARQPLWEYNLHYGHGTGHGIGYILNCHEGPNNISYHRESAIMEEGMITSNEPGLYIKGEYGIRHENIILCKKHIKNEFGQFMRFESLTLVPFDLKGINVNYLSSEEIKTLNNYHKLVYKKISPYLSTKERNWLKKQTKSI